MECNFYDTNRTLNIHDVVCSQGVIPLGGCVVTASEDLGMPFAITVGLDGFSVRALPGVFFCVL